jgi:hypothetical protein
MKNSLIVLALVAVCLVGAGAFVLGLTLRQHRALVAALEQDRAAAASPSASPERAGADAQALQERMERLESSLVQISGELAALQGELARRPVADAVDEGEGAAGARDLAAIRSAFTPEQRAAVAQIIGEERARLERERDEERKAAEQRTVESRAAQIAKELGFGPADERALTDLMLAFNEKREAMFREVREGAGGFGPEMRDTMGARFGELRTEYQDALTKAFGGDNAERIVRLSTRGFGDWGPGRGFGGGGSDAGGGAGNTGRPGGPPGRGGGQ